MIHFQKTLKHWKSDSFVQSLKSELVKVDLDELPLLKATSHGGLISEKPISITVLKSMEDSEVIIIVVGLFFIELAPSCNCGEEPMEVNGYCELKITINKSNAETHFILLDNNQQPDI